MSTYLLLMALLCATVQSKQNASSLIKASTSVSSSTTSSPGSVSSMAQSSSSFASSTSPGPRPSPPPITQEFITFQNQYLYLNLKNITITSGSSSFKNLTKASLEKMIPLNYTSIQSTQQSVHQIILKKFFGPKNNPTFYIAFYFTKDTSEESPNWLLSNLQHQSLPSGELFQYKGIQLSVWAPSGVQYQCQHISLHGSNYNNTNSIVTIVELMGIRVQPFLDNGKPSEVSYSCAGHSPNNQTIGLVVGLVLSLAVLLAAVVIVVSIVVSKKFSRREYNILD